MSKVSVSTQPTSPKSFHDEEALGKAVDLQLLRKLWPFVRPHAKPLLFSLLLLPIAAMLVAIRPRVMRYGIDEGAIPGQLHVVDRAAFLFLGIVTLEYVCRFVQMYTLQLAGARAMADLRLHVFRFLQRVKLSYLDSQPVGRLVTRVTNDVDALGELFASGALNAFGDLLTLVLIVIMMFALDVRLSLIALACLPPLALFVNWVRRRAREAFRDIRSRTARLNSFMNEQVQGVMVIQAYNREAASQREFNVENEAYREANYRAIFFDATLDALIEGISIVCTALILWFVGVRGLKLGVAILSFGTLIAFFQYLEQFFNPIRELTARYTLLQSAMAGAERIFKLLETPDIEDLQNQPSMVVTSNEKNTTKSISSTAIEFKNVSFAYKANVPVLEKINLTVNTHESIAIVGATGSGKSTITSLILRFYKQNEGSISIFGRDIQSYGSKELRDLFAVVPQDVYLFSGTIASNIALGETTIDRPRVEQVLERLGALHLFQQRGISIDTPIGERGSGLSTGERQLVAFARALYHNPPVLILDEATANIDSETEAQIQKALEVVLENRTSIIIAHRLSTIRKANRIFVVHHGHIAEVGTHHELLAHNGIYARLYRIQFSEHDSSKNT